METGLDLYFFPPSPPTRAVMLLVKVLGLVVNMKMVNLMEKEQMKPEFLKLNPMHTVPTIDDNEYVLWESRAIMQYLVDRFDKEGRFTVTDAKKRGKVNQLLYFDADMLFPKIFAYFEPVVMGLNKPNPETLKGIDQALSALETMLGSSKFSVGDELSLADISLVSTISTAEAIQVDISKYPNILNWYENVKNELGPFDYQAINQNGANMIGDAFKANV